MPDVDRPGDGRSAPHPLGSPAPAGNEEPVLIAEYSQVNDNFRALADIRFKLLGFLPVLSAAGIGLLSRDPGSPSTLLLSVLGFVITLGVVMYDQRNSELYNDLIDRAKFLEWRFGIPQARAWSAAGGQFNERPRPGRHLLGVTLKHDRALSLVYGAVLGGWVFPIVRSGLLVTGRGGEATTSRTGLTDALASLMGRPERSPEPVPPWIDSWALGAAAAAALLAIWWLQRLDRSPAGRLSIDSVGSPQT